MTTSERPLSAVPDAPFSEGVPTVVSGKDVIAAAKSIQQEGIEHEQRDGKLGGTLPTFEGKEVEFTAAKITSVAGLEIDDAVWPVDHYVRMVVECRVVGIDHKVNEKTGKLGRVHLLKAIDSTVVAWDYQG